MTGRDSRPVMRDWTRRLRGVSPISLHAMRQTLSVSRLTFHTSRFTCVFLTLALWLLAPATAHAQDRIVALSPEKGPTGGGTVVSIEVEGGVVLGPLRVEFGGRPAGVLRRTGLSTLEAVAPPGDPGPAPVQVVNELWGTATSPAVFTYLPPPPRLVRLDPPAVPVGSEGVVLSIEGEHFAATSSLRVGETQVPVTVVSQKRLQARIPAPLLARAWTLEVRVIDAALGGGTSNGLSLSVTNPVPEVTAIEAPPLLAPASGATAITVRGRGFRPESLVYLAGTAVTTRFQTGEELTALIPPALLAKAGDLPVTVVTPGPGGGASNAVDLAVRAPFPGRYLAFTSNRRGGRNHVYLLDREAGRLDPLEEANSTNGNDGYPSISADGRFIVFQSDRNRGQADVFLFDRETRRLDPLPELNHPTAFDGFPHISADGRFIVFESDRLNGRPKIFLFDRQTRVRSELGQANEATADDGLAAISN